MTVLAIKVSKLLQKPAINCLTKGFENLCRVTAQTIKLPPKKLYKDKTIPCDTKTVEQLFTDFDQSCRRQPELTC